MKPEEPQITFRFDQNAGTSDQPPDPPMIPLPTSATTLDQIRAFGKLESPGENEAQELANHLIESERDRESWPGNLLYCFFVNAYEHDGFRPFDLRALARIIEGILIQCDGIATELATEPPISLATTSTADPLALPDLSRFDQLGLNLASGYPEIFFEHMQCDCLDWQTIRRKFPVTCPGRMCKHLSRIIHVNIGQVPPITEALKRLIAWAGETTSALPPQPEWQLLIDEPESMIGASGDGKAAVIFADADAGQYKQFTYVIADRHWSNNQRPTQNDHPALHDFLSRLIASESNNNESST